MIIARPLAFLTALAGVALAIPSVGAAQTPAVAHQSAVIDIAKMRPKGLLVDPYSYMSPPHNLYYFHHIDELGFRIDPVRRSGPVFPLVTGRVAPFDATIRVEGKDVSLDEYIAQGYVTGLLVLHGDTVLYERYAHGADRRSRFVSQSVEKSIVSILVGTAIEAGKLGSVDDPVTKYLPELASSGYRDATIKNVLQMATGVDYNENYRDSTSGAASIGAALVSGMPSFSDFVRSMKPTATKPGTEFNYQSVNTQLLGLLLERVTGERLNRWAEQKLWSKLGAESDAFIYQAKGQPNSCAFACFNATVRDYARVGLLMMRGGELGGRRVVSESWVRQSTTPDADYLRPAPPDSTGRPRVGYAYQWWIPYGGEGVFVASGIYGQSIYVNPARGVVVVQTSAWPTPGGTRWLQAAREAAFSAIARQAAGR
ncbi:MAG: serine hydrolase [Gemmatimonadota bacterium]